MKKVFGSIDLEALTERIGAVKVSEGKAEICVTLGYPWPEMSELLEMRTAIEAMCGKPVIFA